MIQLFHGDVDSNKSFAEIGCKFLARGLSIGAALKYGVDSLKTLGVVSSNFRHLGRTLHVFMKIAKISNEGLARKR